MERYTHISTSEQRLCFMSPAGGEYVDSATVESTDSKAKAESTDSGRLKSDVEAQMKRCADIVAKMKGEKAKPWLEKMEELRDKLDQNDAVTLNKLIAELGKLEDPLQKFNDMLKAAEAFRNGRIYYKEISAVRPDTTRYETVLNKYNQAKS